MALIHAQKAEVVHARELAEVVDDPDLGVGVIVLVRLVAGLEDHGLDLAPAHAEDHRRHIPRPELDTHTLCPLGEDVRKTGVLHHHLEAVGFVRLEVAENEVIQTHDLLVEGLGAAAEADLEAAEDVVHEVGLEHPHSPDLRLGRASDPWAPRLTEPIPNSARRTICEKKP